MLSLYCRGLIPKCDWGFYLEVSGQLLLLPSPSPRLLSPSLVSEVETVVHSWNPVLLLLWELEVSHCVSFPVFGLREKWTIGGCSVMNVTHPFETHFAVLPKQRSCGSWPTRRELCWHGAPPTAGWRNCSLGLRFHCLSAPNVLFFVFLPSCSSV